MVRNRLRTTALLLIVVGIVLLLGPVFGFTTFSADRGVDVTAAEDPDGLIGIYDNTVDEELALAPQQGWGEESVAIYDLEDQIDEFEADDFTADITRLEGDDGVVQDPAMMAYVDQNGNDFELLVTCDENNGAEVDGHYTIVVDVTASSTNTIVEFERQTSDTVEIFCEGDDTDQPPFFDVEITDTNSPIDGGETLEVDAEVTNLGDEEDTQDVRLEIDGEEVDRVEDVTLDSEESEGVTLEWDDAQEGERDVVVRSDDDKAERTITVGDATAIMAVAEDSLGNNNEIQTTFTVETGDETDYEFEVSIEDTPGGGGAGGDWAEQTVVIDDETFELTDAAADDIAVDFNERDLLSPGSYEDADEETLEEIRDSLDMDSSIEEQTDSGNVDLILDIQ